MPVATIIKYDDERGFGFLRQDGGDSDLFFHVRQVDQRLAEDLKAGLRVQFEHGSSRDGRPCAVDVRAAQARAAA